MGIYDTNEPLRTYMLGTIDIYRKYFAEKMDEKQKAGFIISRQIVEDIFNELEEGVKGKIYD